MTPLDRIYTFVDQLRPDLACDVITRVFQNWDMNVCRAFLKEVDPAKLPVDVAVHVLVASKNLRKVLRAERLAYSSRMTHNVRLVEALGYVEHLDGEPATRALDHAEPVTRFDADASADARDEAIDRVDRNASPEWKRLALEAVQWVAKRRATFTTDAIWWVLDFADVISPREPRAMGAILKQAERAKWCESTVRFEQTVRTSRHRSDVRVWRSLIVDPSKEDDPQCPH